MHGFQDTSFVRSGHTDIQKPLKRQVSVVEVPARGVWPRKAALELDERIVHPAWTRHVALVELAKPLLSAAGALGVGKQSHLMARAELGLIRR